MNLPNYLPPLRLTGESAALTLEVLEVAMEEGHCENDPALVDVCNLLRAGLGLEQRIYPSNKE